MSNVSKTLIHTALLCEATPFIQELKLKKNLSKKNLYENGSYILVVSGMGKHKTKQELENIFKTYSITKAFNIGIAGCTNKNIKIGELFCVTQNAKNIQNATIKSFDFAVNSTKDITTTLVDMEFEYFFDICKDFKIKEIFSFKIVSDYLEDSIPKKKFVTNLIYNQMPKIKEYL